MHMKMQNKCKKWIFQKNENQQLSNRTLLLRLRTKNCLKFKYCLSHTHTHTCTHAHMYTRMHAHRHTCMHAASPHTHGDEYLVVVTCKYNKLTAVSLGMK